MAKRSRRRRRSRAKKKKMEERIQPEFVEEEEIQEEEIQPEFVEEEEIQPEVSKKKRQERKKAGEEWKVLKKRPQERQEKAEEARPTKRAKTEEDESQPESLEEFVAKEVSKKKRRQERKKAEELNEEALKKMQQDWQEIKGRQKEQQKEIKERLKAGIIFRLQMEGVIVDPENQWLNMLDLSQLNTLFEDLMRAAGSGQVKEIWKKAKVAGEKAKVTEDSASAALAAAFKAPFVDPQNTLTMLLQKLDDRQRCASTSTTPCVSVIQSSGTGKSRSLVELSNLNVYVCYCSLQTKSGFPLRTRKLADALIKQDQGEDYYRGYLTAWLEVLYRHFREGLEFASQPSSSSSVPPSPCQQWIADHTLMEKEQVSVVIDAVNEQWVQKRVCTVIEAATALGKVCPLLPRRVGVGILFVFDEAAQLFSDGAGNNIRRAFLSLLQSTFGVFVDTCSNVSVLAPSLDRDPSQRVRAGKLAVPPPVWEISNVNVLAEDLESFENVEDLTLQRLFKYGRPLWASCMSSIADEIKKRSQAKHDDQTVMAVAMKEAQALATRKLCGGVQEDALGKIRAGGELLDPTTAMAILGARLVIDVNPLSRLATNLVASHMSYVLDISDDNGCILSCEPWDPIITHAAKDMFGHEGFRIAALGHLQNCMEKHWVDEGKIGELVGRYLLLRAMDVVKKQQYVMLQDFLDVLVGDMQGGMRDGLVNFCGFVQAIGYTPNLKDLMHAFIVQKAYLCRINQTRFDALIPVLLPEKDGSFLLKPENMSILGIQFKNIIGNRNMAFDASIWMSPQAAGIGGWPSEQPFVTLLMQLGRRGEGCVQFVQNDKPVTRSAKDQPTTSQEAQVPSIKQLSLVVYGLMGVYRFLEEKERKLLLELIQCRMHPLIVPRVIKFARTVMPFSLKRRPN